MKKGEVVAELVDIVPHTAHSSYKQPIAHIIEFLMLGVEEQLDILLLHLAHRFVRCFAKSTHGLVQLALERGLMEEQSPIVIMECSVYFLSGESR